LEAPVQHLLIPPFSKEEENNGSSSTTPTSGKVVSPLFARKGTMTGSSDDDALPTNVTKVEQLADLPKEFLSSGTTIQKDRPLRYEDDTGQVYHYSLRPMTYSVILILLVELLERFAFYGINYTVRSIYIITNPLFDTPANNTTLFGTNPLLNNIKLTKCFILFSIMFHYMLHVFCEIKANCFFDGCV
jgi:hypothetical protein